MKKRSLIFGLVAFVCAALVFSGCESPTDGSSGVSGLDGAITLGGSGGTVDAATLAAVFKVADRILILPDTANVDGKIPAGKTLFVSGATAVNDSETLEVEGVLEIFEGAALDASGVSSTAGYLTGTGLVRGDGTVTLPYYVDPDDIPEDGITYTTGNVSTQKGVGSYAAAKTPPATIDSTGLAAIFDLDGVNALTVKDIKTFTADAIPANKTLTLIGDGNTIAASLDLTDKGTLVVAEGAELAVSGGTLKGSITNNGTITTTDTTADNVLSYITVPTGPGKVEIGGDVDLSAKTAAAALTQNVEVASSKKLTAPNIATPFSGGKTITVAEDGTLDLGATATGVGVPVNNEGSVTTATTSAAALNTILAIKGDIESSGAVVGDAAITVPADTALTIASGGSLTVAKDITLTVSGDATFTVEGTLNVAADAEVEVASGGVFSVENGGSGDLNGTITIKSGGVSKDLNQAGGSLWDTNSTGTYVFESGAIAYITSDTDPPMIGTTDDNAILQLAAGTTFSNSKTAYTLDGDATLHGAYFSADTTIEADTTLTIGSSGILGPVVATSTTAIKGKAGAKIVVVDGYIDIYESSLQYQNDISNMPHNFYSATGTKETANSFQGTYAWDAGAGGQDVAGWLKQAAPPAP